MKHRFDEFRQRDLLKKRQDQRKTHDVSRISKSPKISKNQGFKNRNRDMAEYITEGAINSIIRYHRTIGTSSEKTSQQIQHEKFQTEYEKLLREEIPEVKEAYEQKITARLDTIKKSYDKALDDYNHINQDMQGYSGSERRSFALVRLNKLEDMAQTLKLYIEEATRFSRTLHKLQAQNDVPSQLELVSLEEKIQQAQKEHRFVKQESLHIFNDNPGVTPSYEKGISAVAEAAREVRQTHPLAPPPEQTESTTEEAIDHFTAWNRYDLAKEKYHVILARKDYRSIPMTYRIKLEYGYDMIQYSQSSIKTPKDMNKRAEQIEALTDQLEKQIASYKQTFEQGVLFMKTAYCEEALTLEECKQWWNKGALDFKQRYQLTQKVLEKMIERELSSQQGEAETTDHQLESRSEESSLPDDHRPQAKLSPHIEMIEREEIHEKIISTFSDLRDSKVYHDMIRQILEKKEEVLLIESTKSAFGIIKKAYDSVDDNVKEIIIGENLWEILGALSGKKAKASQIPYDESLVEAIKEHAGDDFIVVQDFDPEEFSIVSKSKLKKVMDQNRERFPFYTPESSIDSSLLERMNFSGTPQERQIRVGLSFGYPLRDVEQYAQFNDQKVLFSELVEQVCSGETPCLQQGDEKLLSQYAQYDDLFSEYEAKDKIDDMRKLDEKYQNFLKENEEALFEIMDRYNLNMSKEAKEYAIYARMVGTRGIGQLSTNPNSAENRRLMRDTDTMYDRSGIRPWLEQQRMNN